MKLKSCRFPEGIINRYNPEIRENKPVIVKKYQFLEADFKPGLEK